MINSPCPSAASASILPWPKRCSWSAGVAAWMTLSIVTVEVIASKVESISEVITLTESVMR